MTITRTRVYTWVASLGLLAQGAATLAALLVPAIDRAMPALLQETQMVASHSLLHIGTGMLGLAALAWRGRGGTDWPRRFAIGFGLFYVVLAVAGERSGAPLCLGLKPFDHSVHAVLGGIGLLAAAIDDIRSYLAARTST
ncbi:MAG: hypothetical protein HZC37_07185 [Burkholderiales bacterium]|nr:hypothetical protein [Burkholderiales bacterium]